MSSQVSGLSVTNTGKTTSIASLASMIKGKGDSKSLKRRIAAVALIAFTVLEFTLRTFIPKLIGVPVVLLATACSLYLLFTLKTQKVNSDSATNPPATEKIKQKSTPKPVDDNKPLVDPELAKYVAEFEKDETPSIKCIEYIRGSLEAVKRLGTKLDFNKSAILPSFSFIRLLSYNPNSKTSFPPIEVFEQMCLTAIDKKIFIIDYLEPLFTHPKPEQMAGYFIYLKDNQNLLKLAQGALAIEYKMIDIWTRVTPKAVPLLVGLGLDINQAHSKDGYTPLLLLIAHNIEKFKSYESSGKNDYKQEIEERLIPLMEALVANGADPLKTILFEGQQINALNYTPHKFIETAVTPKKPTNKE